MQKYTRSGEIPLFRPIVPSIGAYSYRLAKFLSKMLTPHICVDYSCAGTFTFVNEIQNVGISNDNFIVSYDVESLSTNIPLGETIDIAVNTLLENKPGMEISRDDLKKLFKLATSGTQFMFNGNFYEQLDGVAMGSSIAPILANLFLGYHEGKWIGDYEGNKPSYYKRYVDDIIAGFENENEAKSFLAYLNSKHNNIKFTLEMEKEKRLPFLDVLLDNSQKLVPSIYRKGTFSGVLTNYFSFTPMKYKIGLVRCLIDRIFKFNNIRLGFRKDFKNVFKILGCNYYPKYIIIKLLKFSMKREEKKTEESKNSYFKLPYIDKLSTTFKIKLQKGCAKILQRCEYEIGIPIMQVTRYVQYEGQPGVEVHGGL